MVKAQLDAQRLERDAATVVEELGRIIPELTKEHKRELALAYAQTALYEIGVMNDGFRTKISKEIGDELDSQSEGTGDRFRQGIKGSAFQNKFSELGDFCITHRKGSIQIQATRIVS